ncbi:MAG: TIGR01906 family membrane protein [Clostridiaceae bacterium]
MMKRIVTILASLSLAFFILTSSVMLTLSIKQTYRLSKEDIVQVEYNLTDQQIDKNYNNLIDYMFAGSEATLKFDTLPMSPQGEFHFMEVKNLFKFAFFGMILSGVIALVCGAYLISQRNFLFLTKGSILVFIIPAILSIPVLINFNATFIKFHELVFSNDYWIFDPRVDPIIRYLPESLFLKNTLIILWFIVLWVVLIQLFRRYTQKTWSL